MIPEGTKSEEIKEHSAREVAHQIELYCAEQRISRKDLGRAIGYSASVVSEVLKFNYKGDWRQVIADLDAWLEQEIKRAAVPKTTQFVWTSVAREIQMAAMTVMQLKTIGMIYGPDTSGLGKTMALQAIHAETPGSIMITCEKACANVRGLVRAIARALQIADGASNLFLYERIKGILAGTPRLLIVDQIHSLRFAKDDKPLYVLADLHDATGAPQLWCGTSDMVAYLERQQAKGDEPLAQIRGRINYVCDLMERSRSPEHGGTGEPRFTVDEIRKMFAANKVKLTSAAARFLCQLANKPDSGALRLCRNVVRIATLVAEHQGCTSLDVDRLQESLRRAVRLNTFTEFEAERNHEPIRAAMAG